MADDPVGRKLRDRGLRIAEIDRNHRHLGCAGDINIGANAIDYLAKVSFVASSSGQGGKDVADLSGKTLPVKIDGPLDAPQFHPDLSALFRDVAKQQIQKQEDKLKERLQDKLKGLLRR